MCRVDFRFYPSLLDKFERYCRAEQEFESRWNIDAEGCYKRTYEEVERELFVSLIDAINRVPFASEAADRGTAFNVLVDALLHGERPDGIPIRGDKQKDRLEAKVNDRTFFFSWAFVQEAADYFKGSVSQVAVSAMLPTRYGNVELYGFVDELRHDTVFDIKTTSRYEFGKYAGGWQRHVYPWCLLASGACREIRAFEYTAYKLDAPTVSRRTITGTQYPETFVYDHRESESLLREVCERFIEFVSANQRYITDRKITGGENPPDYIGKTIKTVKI